LKKIKTINNIVFNSVFDLNQTYGSFHAIDGISFNVEYGKVFGFLGPNGASLDLME
jgi:ABC-type multidrug transport system ATPase subunit